MKRHFNCALTIAQEKRLVAGYKRGTSSLELARLFGLKSHVSVLKILGIYGVPRRTYRENLLGTQHARRHQVDQEFFKKIDTEQKAYFLGLLFADGWVRRGEGVGLSSTDRELVEGLKKALQSTHPITEKCEKRMLGAKSQYSIFVCCKALADQLESLGCTPAKSKTLRFPTAVPKRLLHHFIRGLWDGDGCVRATTNGVSVGLCGTRHVVSVVRDWLVQYGLPKAAVRPHSSIYKIEYNGRVSVLLFRCAVYNRATTFLQRKKDKVFMDGQVMREGAAALVLPHHLRGAVTCATRSTALTSCRAGVVASVASTTARSTASASHAVTFRARTSTAKPWPRRPRR